MMKVKDYHVILGLKVDQIMDAYIKSCFLRLMGKV